MIVHAPYGFVPLNERVLLPDWAPAVSQDWPFCDGVSGTLDVEITAHTPLFVRGAHDPASFFRGPDGLPAIPGSSVRGLLRSTVEIASWGWMKRVNDHRYGVRDLQNQALYVRHMAAIMEAPDGKKLPMPRVMAGWLQRADIDQVEGGDEDVVATLTPCSFAKMDYRMITEVAGTRGVPRYRPGDPQISVSKYQTWGVTSSRDPKLSVSVAVETLRPTDAVSLPVGFGKVTGRGATPGTLVFTGQPSRWTPEMAPRPGGGHPKHHDFVFYGDRPDLPVRVTRAVMRGFEFVHGDGQQQHSLDRRKNRNKEWAFWGDAYDRGERVPVFFLLREGTRHGAPAPVLRAFGLAMMFRLAYDRTTRDAVRSGQRSLGRDPRPDLAELVFGHVPLERKRRGSVADDARKGRVSVGMARLVAGGAALDKVETVLGGPKASFYPSYLEQVPNKPGEPPPGGKDNYKTYMDEDARVRGYKRYRPQPDVVKGPPPPTRGDGSVNDKVSSTFRPLAAGSTFRMRVRVHNLRMAELGALLWALDHGGRPEAFHTLGMARSLGYGRVSLAVVGRDLQRNDGVEEDGARTEQEARARFQEMMEAYCRGQGMKNGWAGSRRITELLALATVLPADSPHRYHMSIAAPDPVRTGAKLNEFAATKRAGETLRAASTGHGQPVASTSQGHPPDLDRNGAVSPAGGGAVIDRPRPTGVWSPLRGGAELEMELTGLNAKGKWQVKGTIQGFDVTATVGQGDPPADAAAGQVRKVVVAAGGDRRNLGLRWGNRS